MLVLADPTSLPGVAAVEHMWSWCGVVVVVVVAVAAAASLLLASAYWMYWG